MYYDMFLRGQMRSGTQWEMRIDYKDIAFDYADRGFDVDWDTYRCILMGC